MGDHTECFQVEYDPAAISFEDLLELFWQSHDPTRPAFKTQYASLILTADEQQLEQAQQSAAMIERLFGAKVNTRIEPLRDFWLAEDYHQKYYLRHERIVYSELRDYYPAELDFVASTAAMRANGYLYGAGSCARLDKELPQFGLSDRAAEALRSHCR